MKRKAIIITGPTGSGKSDLAIQIGLKNNGVIINADSMQIYKQIPIISAQPSLEDKERIEHFLYGFIDIKNTSHIYSVGDYLQDLKRVLDDILKTNKTPIIVGGTMLYIQSIANGLNEIDNIPDNIKQEIRNKYLNITANELFEELQKIDEKYSKIVDKNNTHRLLRGLEVKIATNRSIVDFWNDKKNNVFDELFEFEKYVIDMPRDILYDRINSRFDKMVQNGAVEEVRQLFNECIKDNIDLYKLPKAIGLYELFNYFQNELSLRDAIEKSKQFSRNYAKRQITWFRNKLDNGFIKIKL